MIRTFEVEGSVKWFWNLAKRIEYDTKTNVGTSVGHDESRTMIPTGVYPIARCIKGVEFGVLKEITGEEV